MAPGSALLEQLVLEKLTADAEALKENEGWKWVDCAIDFHSATLPASVASMASRPNGPRRTP